MCIRDRLKLDTSITADDIKYELRPSIKNPKDFISELKLDPEARYNLDHVNNDTGIGFNNLEGRVRGEEAHESVFDQMMAQYFLDKRREYKDSNQLLKDLEAHFT